MAILRLLRDLIERIFGIYMYRKLPRGINMFRDISLSMPDYSFNVVFDVGANEGQSIRFYKKYCPTAQFYCFEPAKDTFEILSSNVGSGNVHCLNFALSDRNSDAELVRSGSSDTFYVHDPDAHQEDEVGANRESISLKRLDDYCKQAEISHISLLKIDTEGSDFSVLQGAESMLTEHKVDWIVVEAGMNPNNTRHVPFEKIKAYLESKGYYLFAFYEQVNEWPTSEPNLRRTNPLFMSQRLYRNA